MNLSDLNGNAAKAPLAASIRNTLQNTFITLSGLTFLAAIASYFSLNVALTLPLLIVVLVASIVLIIGVYAFKNSVLGLVALGLFSLLQGLCIGPVVNSVLAIQGGEVIVMQAALLTAAALGLCASYVTFTRKDFSRLRMFLFVGTILLVIAMIASMFFPAWGGSLMLSYLGVLLFIGWLLYDISEIVSGRQTNYIVAALGIFLDVVNLFLFFLRIGRN